MPSALKTVTPKHNSKNKFQIDRESYEPAYIQLKNQIIEKISSGEYLPGSKIPSVRELVKLTGLSSNTTAKTISDLVQEKIVHNQVGIGNVVAEKKCRTIGIMGGFRKERFYFDHYYMGIMSGIHEAIHDRDIAYVFKQISGKLKDTFKDIPVDGIIFLGSQAFPQLKKEIIDLAKGTRIVLIGSMTSDKRFNHIQSDNYKTSYEGTKILLEKGYRKIVALITKAEQDRLRGYKDALQNNGAKIDETLIIYYSKKLADDKQEQQKTIEHLNKINPDSFFVTSSKLFELLLEPWLERKGKNKKPPAVVNFAPLPEHLKKYKIPHIIISQPYHDLGKIAAEKLIKLVEGEILPPVKVVLKAELIVNL